MDAQAQVRTATSMRVKKERRLTTAMQVEKAIEIAWNPSADAALKP
ncbi:MAG: hypothetical protein INR71_02360, partial [Terriglobus roseus]|nr:hypothetical protein [Terriglobus roseus]